MHIRTTWFRVPISMMAWALVASMLATAGVIGIGAVGPASAAGLSNPGALTVHQGSLTVRDDGAVIQNLEIRGTLRIEASNVTVRNVWVYTSNSWSIYVAAGSATFDNIEVGHPSHVGERGIGGSNVTVRNADIHHVEDGIKLGSNAHYSSVRVHDLASTGSGPHADAVQVEGTAKNSSVRNSVLSSTGKVGLGNAAVIIKSDLGPQSNITFADNYLNGGNYTVYVRDGGYGVPSNVSFTGNRFGPDRRYGVLVADGKVTWENNTLASTGELIDRSGKLSSGPGGFVDIAGSVHRDNIVELAERGITSSGAYYRPNERVTRGQMAAFIRRALDLPSASKDYFSDDNDSVFEDDINAIARAGITDTGTSSYRPDRSVTRGQMAAFIARAFGIDESGGTPFKDISDSVFKADIASIYNAGITVGTSKTSYSPGNAVTRGQMATFIIKSLDH